MTIRVLIVDDDPLVRSGLTLMVGGSQHIDVVGEASDGQAALEWLTHHDADVVLMDVRMPILDGIAATEAISQRTPAPQVIVLTTFDDDDYVVRALACGASGFVLKDTPPPDIVHAIHKVHDGEPMLSPSVTEKLIHRVTHAAPGHNGDEASLRVAQLTDRERGVAIAIGKGLSNAQIAAELYMSLATVKAHVTQILVKLNATNRVQIAVTVHDAGLLTD